MVGVVHLFPLGDDQDCPSGSVFVGHCTPVIAFPSSSLGLGVDDAAEGLYCSRCLFAQEGLGGGGVELKVVEIARKTD